MRKQPQSPPRFYKKAERPPAPPQICKKAQQAHVDSLLYPTVTVNNERIITNMPERKLVYTLPWGMLVDEEGYLWLNLSTPYTLGEIGTSCMGVSKTDGEYYVDVTRCDEHRIAFWLNRSNHRHVNKVNFVPVKQLCILVKGLDYE